MGEKPPADGANEADAGLEIRVLGAFAVLRNGSDVGLPPSRKTRALLAYLAVVDSPQPRDRLCEMFWDVPDDPRAALRWSLSKIRQIVDREGRPALVTDRNTVALRSESVALDLRRVTPAALHDLAALDTSELEDLAQLFRGAFLEDLSLPRFPKFEAWRMSQVDKVDLCRTQILRALIDRLEGDASRALPYAHALQAMHPGDGAVATALAALVARARAQATKPPEQPLDLALSEPSSAQPMPAAPDIRSCTAADGVRIAYSVVGEGPPIVKVATWMSQLQFDGESPIWRHWIEGLTAQNRLIAYDQRGSGLSDGTVDDLSFDTLVADLERVVDAARLDRFTLLGLSGGCAIAIAYAARHPERVSHLVLCGGYARGWRARGDSDEIARRDALRTLMAQGWGMNNPAFRALFTSLFVPEATPEQMEWFNELQRKVLLPQNAARLYETFANIDISALLSRVTSPTLVLHASGDQFVPFDCGRALAEGIAGARLVPLDGSNHVLLAHQPAFTRFLDEMRRFIATDDQAPGSTEASETDAEPRHVTVLAVEIVSPLHAFASMDPGVVMRQIDPLLELAFGIIEQNGGIVSASGDANILAAFDTSPAREHAASACRAALTIKSTLELKSEGTVRVRAGLDTGDVIVRRRRRGGSGQIEVAGGPVRTAARLAQSLRRGALALTGRTRDAVAPLFDVARLARSDLPKFDRDEQAYELKGARSGD